jgi:iron complex outermembrane receptor protein
VDFGYTVIHGAQAALDGLQSKYVFNYPDEQAVVSWERLSASGWVAHFRTGVTKQYQRSTYVLVDASAGWTRSRLHPYARVTNLANADYQPVLGVTMPGRAIICGLEVEVFGSSHP